MPTMVAAAKADDGDVLHFDAGGVQKVTHPATST
jgi:hypothetical protein